MPVIAGPGFGFQYAGMQLAMTTARSLLDTVACESS